MTPTKDEELDFIVWLLDDTITTTAKASPVSRITAGLTSAGFSATRTTLDTVASDLWRAARMITAKGDGLAEFLTYPVWGPADYAQEASRVRNAGFDLLAEIVQHDVTRADSLVAAA